MKLNLNLKVTKRQIMQIENYIKDLLFRYDCVIIPNLGAFMVKFESSTINEFTNQLNPPKRTLAFNGQIKSEDVLLINYISQKENLDFEDAKTYLASYIEDLKKVLSIERSFQLNGLGRLQLAEENQLTFFPENNQNFYKESFGLSSLSLVTANQTEEGVEVPVVKLGKPTQEEKSSSLLKYAALVVIALSVSSIGYFLTTNYTSEAYQQSVSEKVEQEIQREIQVANFFVDQALPEIEIEVKKEKDQRLEGLKYHVIAGAFRREENAQKKIKDLLDEGFEARYLGTNKYNLHQVAYYSFASRSEAINALTKIRKSHQDSAWLLVGEFLEN